MGFAAPACMDAGGDPFSFFHSSSLYCPCHSLYHSPLSPSLFFFTYFSHAASCLDISAMPSTTSACCPFESCLSSRMSLRSEEHTSELQSRQYLVCRLLLEKKKNTSRAIRQLYHTS